MGRHGAPWGAVPGWLLSSLQQGVAQQPYYRNRVFVALSSSLSTPCESTDIPYHWFRCAPVNLTV